MENKTNKKYCFLLKVKNFIAFKHTYGIMLAIGCHLQCIS